MNAYEQKMIQEMQLKNFTPATQAVYVQVVDRMSRHLGRPADQVSSTEIKQYLLFLQNDRKLAASSVEHAISALKFLVNVALDRKSDPLLIDFRKSERPLPDIFSVHEVKQLISCADNLRRRVILLLAYSAGLRLSEIVRLKVGDIDSSRMMIHVRNGKMHKDRYTLLSPHLLSQLRAYWKLYKPTDYLFPGKAEGTHASTALVHKAYRLAKRKSGIRKGKGIHTLRHCFGTHLLESGVDLRTIQVLMGHGSIVTTAGYLQVTEKKVDQAKRAMDLLAYY
jgi:integrase/recombinase XerD